MNLSPDLPTFGSAIKAARRVDCGQCAALAGDECIYTTTPASVPVASGAPVRPVRGYHAGRLVHAGIEVPGVPPATIVWDNGDAPRLPDGDAGKIDAVAAAILGGKVATLREYVGRALGDEHHNRQEALERVAEELARVSMILAAATEGVDDDEDDAEPYCLTCGQWVHMFHGHEGWQHFRGQGTAASPVELYDAGHEAVVRWTVPPGRPLSPGDIGLILQALADASAWRSWRSAAAGCEGCAQLDPDSCAGHAADEAQATSYDCLLRRLAGQEAAEAPGERGTRHEATLAERHARESR
jgi:hypothetical protein